MLRCRLFCLVFAVNLIVGFSIPASCQSGTDACISSKLKAASTLCKIYATYYANIIKNQGAPPESSITKIEKAKLKFGSAWDKAEAKALKKGADCVTSAANTVEEFIRLSMLAIFDRIIVGSPLGDKDFGNLGRSLMKAFGQRCCSLLNAQSANIKKPNSAKLTTAVSKADGKFISSWNKALAKANRKGVTYVAPPISEVEGLIDDLVEGVLALVNSDSDGLSPEASETIGPEGGVVEVTDPESPIFGVKIEVPEGALNKSGQIRISHIENAPSFQNGVSPNGPVIDITCSNNTEFDKAFLINIPVEESPLEDEYLDTFYYNENKAEWESVLTWHDYEKNEMVVLIDHLSKFRIGKQRIPDATEAVTTDFNMKTDTMQYENGDGNACLGMSYFTEWYYEHHANDYGLRCYYDYSSSKAISKLTHDEANSDNILSDFLGLLQWITTAFDQSKTKATLINSLKEGKPKTIVLGGPLGGHAAVVYSWTPTEYGNGYFTCYDVNNNNYPIEIFAINNPSIIPGTNWVRMYVEYPPDFREEDKRDWKLFGIWNKGSLDIESIYNDNVGDKLCDFGDFDNDGILDDGNYTGVIGDDKCRDGKSLECDDNCPERANPDQADSDGDGIGDVCDETPGDDYVYALDYYPLTIGYEWQGTEYRYKNLGYKTINGKQTVMHASDHGSKDPWNQAAYDCYVNDSEGLVGHGFAHYDLLIPSEPIRILNAIVKKGDRIINFVPEVAPNLTLVYTVLSINDTVTVPAGTFHNCIKLQEEVIDDPGCVQHETKYVWFAPGIGKVKVDNLSGSDCGLFWESEELLSFNESSSGGIDTVTSTTGQVWMDRNLGASRVATSSTDSAAYGDLYQWGRGTDGHEKRTSSPTSINSSTDDPGHGSFILEPNSPDDWRVPQNNNLWQGESGTNNPCPAGFRLPTETELNNERASWSSNNSAGAFNSPLKLVVAGARGRLNGTLHYVGSDGYYWSSTVDGRYSSFLLFTSDFALMDSLNRTSGGCVRCLKD